MERLGEFIVLTACPYKERSDFSRSSFFFSREAGKSCPCGMAGLQNIWEHFLFTRKSQTPSILTGGRVV